MRLFLLLLWQLWVIYLHWGNFTQKHEKKVKDLCPTSWSSLRPLDCSQKSQVLSLFSLPLLLMLLTKWILKVLLLICLFSKKILAWMSMVLSQKSTLKPFLRALKYNSFVLNMRIVSTKDWRYGHRPYIIHNAVQAAYENNLFLGAICTQVS